MAAETEHTRPTLVAVPAPPAEVEQGVEPTPGSPAVYADISQPQRKPILPPWLSSRDGFKHHTRRVRGLAWYLACFHGLRSPVYLALMVFWGVVGAARLLWRWLCWWLMPVPPEVYQAARTGPPGSWKGLHQTHRKTAKVRFFISAGVLVAVWLGISDAAKYLPPWAWAPLAAAAVALLAIFGKPPSARIVATSAPPSQYEKLTQDVIVRALGSLGIAPIDKWLKEGREIVFPSPVRQDGPGWRAEVDLPYGVTATQVMERRAQFASGLRRPLGAVWPEPVSAEHEGRLEIWVGQQDVSKAKRPPWPLLRSGQVDIFKPFPFGTDVRGRVVKAMLIFNAWLIGSIPRQGKTAAVRELVCTMALDPIVEMQVHELKGSGDLDAVEGLCTRYVSGIGDDAMAYTAESLRLLRREVERRTERLKALPVDVCPDKKVTRAISSKRGLRLHPVGCVVDEAQNLFLSPYAKEAAADAEFIMKIGPAFGVFLILATQRPDKESMPKGISANASVRFCLKVMGQVENDMILGTSAYKNGLRATTFRASTPTDSADAGMGYLVGGEAGLPQVAHTFYIDMPTSKAIAARARTLREAAGTLPVAAAAETQERNVLADLLGALGDDTAAQWGPLAERLTGLYPDRWSGVTGEALSEQARALGVPSKDVKRGGSTVKGCYRRDVEAKALVGAH